MRLPIASQPEDFKKAVNVTPLWDDSSTPPEYIIVPNP